ncbi:MAG: ABC transporter ATP-binding protein [Microvirga sp.]
MAKPLLDVSGVTIQYKTPQHLVTATYKVSFGVYPSDRYVILGPSGCGKSTLLKAVGGFLEPVEGEIRLRDRKVTAPGPDRMMVFQEFEQLMPWKTVYQNVLFPMQVTGKFRGKDAHDRVNAIVEKVNLTRFKDVYPHMLSGGMKMRVAIARAMALEPDILLMDEPFAAIDAMTREGMQAELERIIAKTRQTVIFITHSIDEAIQLADRVVVISERPGCVREIVDVDLPRSRFEADARSDPRFIELREHVWSLLRDEALGAKVAA